MQSHKRLFTLFLTPGSVPSNSPPEEVVKGHWEGKQGGMGWACTQHHFLTSGTLALPAGKVDFRGLQPQGSPTFWQRLMPSPSIRRHKQRGRRGENQASGQKKSDPVGMGWVSHSYPRAAQPPGQREPTGRELAVVFQVPTVVPDTASPLTWASVSPLCKRTSNTGTMPGWGKEWWEGLLAQIRSSPPQEVDVCGLAQVSGKGGPGRKS